jgi:hypothetical protein
MGRNQSNTVEYFPHVAKGGKTLFILEGKYGNDGYAFWFKLLELLSSSEDHFYDASTEVAWQYLIARAKVTDISATEMLSLLANLGNIDAEMWEGHKIIWCQALIDNLSEVYRKRKRPLPVKPKTHNCDRNQDTCDRNDTSKGISVPESTQSRVEESRVEESKVEKNKNPHIPLSKSSKKKSSAKTPIPENFTISEEIREWAIKQGFDHLEEHLDWFKDYAHANGKLYADWDAAFRNCLKGDWGRVRQNGGNGHESSSSPYKIARPRPDPPGVVIPVPGCPKCGGRGIEPGVGPCSCLHPPED